jgi:hypothetical protein
VKGKVYCGDRSGKAISRKRDGGVYIEFEAIVLSRNITISLRWMVELSTPAEKFPFRRVKIPQP